MADTTFAPYAPPAAVLGVIRHYRVRDVPERITTTNLQQIGVTESLMARTVAALRFLGLIREDMTTTEQFRALRYANDDEYQDVLGRILDAAYKEVLDHIELTTATDREINNAFIPYSPGGQRERMITLFLSLAREAGWTVAASGRSSVPKAKTVRLPRPPRTKTEQRRNSGQEPQGKGRTAVQTPPTDILFGVTEADIAALPEEDFDIVWAALGKVARARARTAAERQESDRQVQEEPIEEEE